MAPRGIPEASTASEPVPTEAAASEGGNLPEWLKGLGTISAPESAPEPPQPPQPPLPSKEANLFPDWLKEMDASAATFPQATIPEEKPEQPGAEQPLEPTPLAPVQPGMQEPSEPQGAASARLDEDAAFQPTGEVKPLKIEDDAMAWLESLAAKQGAKEEELLTKPGERSDEMPDWLRTSKEQPVVSELPEPAAVESEIPPLEPVTPPTAEESSQQPVPPEIPSAEPAETTAQPVNFQGEAEKTVEGTAAIQENPNLEGLKLEEPASSEGIPPVLSAEEPSQPITSEEDSAAWLKDLMGGQTSLAEEQQPSSGSLSEETTIEKPVEDTPQQFAMAEDTDKWMDKLSSGQVSQPEGEQPVPAAPSEVIPTEKPIEATPSPFNSEDDTEAWLEGSAAEQAVQPEELQPIVELPAEEIPAEKPAEVTHPQFTDDMDTDAWLESPTTFEQEPEMGETNPASVEKAETQPEWLQTPAQEPAILEKAPATDIPAAPQEEDITITSWLTKHEVEAELEKARSASQATPSKDRTTEEDLPDWLKEPEQQPAIPEAAPEITLESIPETAPETASETEPEPEPEPEPEQSILDENAPKTDEEIPDWLGESIQPAEDEEKISPVPEISSEEELPPWVDESTPVPEPPEPTTPNEWISAEEEPAPAPNEWISAEEEPAPAPKVEPTPQPANYPMDTPYQRQILGGTGMLSRVPIDDKDAGTLSAAQTALDARNIRESMREYAKLIKRNSLLDEVIHDLREAIYRFPVDISIWQTLGDASMRANRLQDALDAYTKAEELLR